MSPDVVQLTSVESNLLFATALAETLTLGVPEEDDGDVTSLQWSVSAGFARLRD
jgi:hypothetical protein